MENQVHALMRIAEQSPISFIITDANHIIEYVNPMLLQVTGLTKEKISKHISVLQSSLMSEEEFDSILQTLEMTGNWRGEVQNVNSQGARICEAIAIYSVKNDTGTVIQYVTIF